MSYSYETLLISLLCIFVLASLASISILIKSSSHKTSQSNLDKRKKEEERETNRKLNKLLEKSKRIRENNIKRKH